jgi:hypothetical protein
MIDGLSVFTLRVSPSLNHVTEFILDQVPGGDGASDFGAQQLPEAPDDSVHRDSEGTLGHVQSARLFSVITFRD